MSDFTRFTITRPPAGSSMPGKPTALTDGEQVSAHPRGVKPIDPLMLHRIMDRKPQPYAANDRAYREAERRASGGNVGLAILFAVAVVIAVLLATGGAK